MWSLVVCMILTQMLFTNLAFASTKTTALSSSRLAGADRYQTAIEISKADWTTSQYAVLAYGEGFADALAAAPLAGKYDAPILLTDKDALSAGVLAELQRLGVKNVFVVGGEGVVAKAVADAVTAAGMTVERLAGADRYATALAVANKMGTTTEVVVAYGENYPDALSISAIAAAKGMPILLTDKDAMSADVKAYIGAKKAYVVGGEGAVSAAVVNGLTGAVRLSGADRYATNLAVLQQFAADLNWLNVFVATGEGFADALAGSALAARYGSPVVLAGASLAPATASFLTSKIGNQAGVIAFGGAAVVSDAVVSSVKPAAPNSLTVDSITALGLNGVKVVFSQEVDKDSAINVANYSFDGISLDPTKDVSFLASDNKTLYIMKQVKYDQYKKALFTIKDKAVLSKDTLTTIPKNETVLTFSDVAVPAVQSVSVTGNKKITVQFTEPIKMSAAIANASSMFKIDGQYLSSYGFTSGTATTVTTAEAGIDSYGLKLNLMFDVAIPAGAHTLKTLKGSNSVFSDAAGYMVPETDTSFTVDTVTTAPQIVSITAETNGTLYVTFDRAVDTTVSNITTAKFAINSDTMGTGIAANGVTVKSNTSDKVLKIVGSSTLNSGANVLTVKNDFKDAWGNKIHADTNQRYSFTASKDTTKPTVVSVVLVDNQNIRVKYSEDVDSAYGIQKSNYELKDSSGVTKNISNIVLTAADDTYTITTADKLTGSNYTLKIKNVIDKANPSNTIDEYIASVNGLDDVSPTVKQVVQVVNGDGSLSGTKVGVYFSEAMDAATLVDPANYAYLNNKTTTETKALPASCSITAGESNKSVTIEFPTGYSLTTTTVADAAGSNYKVRSIRISNVKDASGNLLADISTIVPVTLAANATDGKPEYSDNTFKLYADSTKAWAEFELNQTLTNLNVADFYISTSTAGTSVTPSSGYISGKKVVLNFTDTKRTDIMALGMTAKLFTSAAPGSTNISGIPMTAYATDAVAKQVWDDQIAPELVTNNGVKYVKVVAAGAVNTTTAAVLTFSENIDGSIAGLYKDDFTFTTSLGVLLTVNKVTVDNADVYFEFEEPIAAAAQVTVKAVTGKISVMDVKDSGAKDQNLYVPKSDDISGRSN